MANDHEGKSASGATLIKVEAGDLTAGHVVWEIPEDVRNYLEIALADRSEADKQRLLTVIQHLILAFFSGASNALSETHFDKSIEKLTIISTALKEMAEKLEK